MSWKVLNQVDMGLIVLASGDLIGSTMINSAHLDEYSIRWLFGRVVEHLGFFAPVFVHSTLGVRGVVPIPALIEEP